MFFKSSPSLDKSLTFQFRLHIGIR